MLSFPPKRWAVKHTQRLINTLSIKNTCQLKVTNKQLPFKRAFQERTAAILEIPQHNVRRISAISVAHTHVQKRKLSRQINTDSKQTGGLKSRIFTSHTLAKSRNLIVSGLSPITFIRRTKRQHHLLLARQTPSASRKKAEAKESQQASG